MIIEMKVMEISVREHIQELFGESVRIVKQTPVSGGDINAAYHLELSDGQELFLKTNRIGLADMFAAEADGLAALGATGVISVVTPLGSGTDTERGCSYLLLEYVREEKASEIFWEDFGRSLALLHMQKTDSWVAGGRYGFFRDTYIGRTPQSNTPQESFITFFRQERFLPQIRMAEHWFNSAALSRFDYLLEHLDNYLVEPDFPSLLHGDLWSGNFLIGQAGRAVLIDPAVYVGCAEVDLAMTELFGGFSEAYYRGYREIFPMASGYEDRRDLYNLYHLLNHLNLFGSGYLSSVLRVLDRYV